MGAVSKGVRGGLHRKRDAKGNYVGERVPMLYIASHKAEDRFQRERPRLGPEMRRASTQR